MSENETVNLAVLWGEQVFLMSKKHINQKQRKGRDFLKETIMIPFFLLAVVAYLFSQINLVYKTQDIYGVHGLPPLSSDGAYGIFSSNSKQNTDNSFVSTKNLYYSPDSHVGVNALMAALVAEYPQVKAIGAANPDVILEDYKSNLFTTWASIQFNLTAEQISTGKLVTSDTQTTLVDYTILINDNIIPLPSGPIDDFVYNDAQAVADYWWTSGYLTIQNFVSTYLAKQYPTVSPDFKVSILCVSCDLQCVSCG